MKFLFLYCFLSKYGEVLYASQEAHINWRPITTQEVCAKEATKIEERMNIDLRNGNSPFVSVAVTCEKGVRLHKK